MVVFALGFLIRRACSDWKHSVLPTQVRSVCVSIDAGRAGFVCSNASEVFLRQ
ncbi:hypothetical protein HMPREF3208_00958 [Gardnerella vaginalis]|uniref:Uncharacterized protein n=1 Tax=Gardnerella vaginalis TaxID=2702 RepID=A0A133NU32_GARVA|nr:hypothetical protein HMPREF3208_00958 [Gardnerella vaginalis]